MAVRLLLAKTTVVLMKTTLRMIVMMAIMTINVHDVHILITGDSPRPGYRGGAS